MVSVTVPSTAYYGSSYTVVATTNASTTPTLTVAPATVCTISGTTVTMIKGTGTCTVTAEWAADDVYKAATATGKTTAEKVASVVTWATPAPITYGAALSAAQLNATASGSRHICVYAGQRQGTRRRQADPIGEVHADSQPTDYTTIIGTTVALVVNPANTTTSINGITPSPSKTWSVSHGKLCGDAGQAGGQCDRQRQQRGNLHGNADGGRRPV